jgi:hypothetical protein
MSKTTLTAPSEMGGTMASMRNVRCDEIYSIAPTSPHLIQHIAHENKAMVLTASKGHHYRAKAIWQILRDTLDIISQSLSKESKMSQ